METFDTLRRIVSSVFHVVGCLLSCSLQVERLSKSVVAKRAELQNLEVESSAKQVRPSYKTKIKFKYFLFV